MNLSFLIPPLGLLGAVLSASATGLWLQAGLSIDLSDRAELAIPGKNNTMSSLGLPLPPRTDAERANMLFLDRPLLAEGRRPFVPAPPTPEPVAEPIAMPPAPLPFVEPRPPPPTLAMVGAMSIDGTSRVLLLDEATGLESWHATGDIVQGWAIVEILPDVTRLQLEGVEITFNLFQ